MIGADPTPAKRYLNHTEFCVMSSGKREAAAAVNQLRGGEPLSDKPSRQSLRGSRYVKVTLKEDVEKTRGQCGAGKVLAEPTVAVDNFWQPLKPRELSEEI
ncbi:hypothetical protein EVAR_103989_1 [Eumeta japonica]|uniref:Uncharacterized protein n=1 Tax=Eumeta variegata TaxID=151549 RepID=A0A4C1Y0E6_EUMVA|nr:hypothetical protein EVAR_103989_1 [Eumeta japonica]